MNTAVFRSHLILYVKDQAKSAAFYAHVLGRRPTLDVPGMTEFTLPGAIEPGALVQAIRAWNVTYPEPLTLVAGERVQVGQRDDEWPGWIWCIDSGGKSGWAPESRLDIDESTHTAIARQNYTAQELSMEPGERLIVQEVESGWAWVTNQVGQSGWVPLTHLVACGS